MAAIAVKIVSPNLALYYAFPLTSSLSLLGGVMGSYMTKATDPEVTAAFYRKLRPFGLWGPVRRKLGLDSPVVLGAMSENRWAIFNTPVAMVWHLSIFLVAIHVVLRSWQRVGYLSLVAGITSVVLYYSWYRKLPPDSPA